MRVLVVGGTGQVARSLAVGATDPGRMESLDVVCVGRPDLDLEAPATVAKVISGSRADVVVNAAAYTAVDQAESEREAAFAINEAGAGAVAAEAHRCGLPVLHISTDYVFDGEKASPYAEGDATSPLGAYGESKLAGEAAVANANPRHVILRTAWVHSPFGKNFVKTMLRLAETRDELGVVDDQVGSPTYAPDLAKAILDVAAAIATRSASTDGWGIYHAAGSGETTWCGMAREVFDQARQHGLPDANVRAITTADYPTPAARPKNSRLDCGKLEAQFGLRMPSWESGVARCVAELARGASA